jgi:predicted transposase YbfD/YdcC
MATSSLRIRKYLCRLKDPRVNRCKRHVLTDIVTMAICAVIGNADTWNDIATFALRRQEWFARFLELPNGIPSQHTFRRVFDRLDPLALQRGLVQWLHDISEILGVRHIAIDGKTLRGSGGGTSPLRPLHLVSAWASEANLFLGQVATEEKSNEITAIPHLLEMLDLKGALVSIDAMGCQKEIARTIVDKKGDYVLMVKGNQEHLEEDIESCFMKVYEKGSQGIRYETYETEEDGHGRHEVRCYEIITEPKGLRNQEAWPQLQVIGKCNTERTVNGKISCEVRYFIGSKRCSVRRYAKALRHHWGIENNLHWQMDVTFGEDASRIQNRHGGENFAMLRRLALGLLKQHAGPGSIRSKRYEAALDVDFLEEVLNNSRSQGKLK